MVNANTYELVMKTFGAEWLGSQVVRIADEADKNSWGIAKVISTVCSDQELYMVARKQSVALQTDLHMIVIDGVREVLKTQAVNA